MKKKVTIEQTFCDVCGKEAAYGEKCMGCEKDFCYDCRKVEAVEYQHGVHFSGGGDGLYCLKCDKEKRENGDKLHAAYRMIQTLRKEAAGYCADFEKRTKKAEEDLKRQQVLSKRINMHRLKITKKLSHGEKRLMSCVVHNTKNHGRGFPVTWIYSLVLSNLF